MFVNNQVAITISQNLVLHGKTKYFNIKLFFLRWVQKDGDMIFLYCKTEEQMVDIFTKALPISKFEFLRQKLRV
ncbi:hypothetical protein MANES_07G065201v8 [Manihot esculenta]|uniref:Uncharacterized protein n=1 Tax=Manihot esculenta TaxID=3983 RepID=A0ACB7HD81_MANES|nr:hypothetical protein MANES_07G065201v8 [Manihot esculenta]